MSVNRSDICRHVMSRLVLQPLRSARDLWVYGLGFGTSRYLPKPSNSSDFGEPFTPIESLPKSGRDFLSKYEFKIIAHRGAELWARENTLDAYALAKEVGAHVMEIDLFLSSDDVVMVSHDPSLRRVFGINKNVSELTSKEMMAQGVNCLEQVFQELPDLGYILDIKCERLATYEKTMGLVHKYKMEKNVLIEGEHTFRDCHRYWRMARLELSEKFPPGSRIGRKIIRQEQEKGRFVYASVTFNSPERMKILIELGIDGIMTPYITTLRKVAQDCGVFKKP